MSRLIDSIANYSANEAVISTFPVETERKKNSTGQNEPDGELWK